MDSWAHALLVSVWSRCNLQQLGADLGASSNDVTFDGLSPRFMAYLKFNVLSPSQSFGPDAISPDVAYAARQVRSAWNTVLKDNKLPPNTDQECTDRSDFHRQIIPPQTRAQPSTFPAFPQRPRRRGDPLTLPG